jgi:hypothetical protein
MSGTRGQWCCLENEECLCWMNLSCLTMDVRSVIQAIHADHVWLLPGGMTSQLYVLVNNSFKDHLK